MVKEWNYVTIKKLSNVVTKGTTPTSIGKSFVSTGINFIKIECIDKRGYFEKEKFEHIDNETNMFLKRSQLMDGDILFSIAGALGRTAIVDKSILPANTNQALAIIRLKNEFNLNNKYIYYQLQSDKIKKVIEEINVSGAQANLSLDNVSNLIIPMPKNVKEQQKIAEALSDMDNLISSLEKLIEKKKTIKQGAMQELLTGKRRLSGFSGEWTNKKLEDYCSLITKQTGFDYSAHIKPALTKHKSINNLPMIQTINFRGKKFDFNTDYYIPKSVAENFPNIILKNKCVLFSIVGASVGNIGLYPGGVSFCGGAIGITRFINEDDAEWVYYYMSSPEGQNQIQYVTKGGAQATVTIADIRNFRIPTPNKEERNAIANILSDMDNEIDTLEQKLHKCQKLKQGMMQQLLTGKIRLVSNVDEVTDKPEVETLKVSTKGHNHQFDDAVVIAGIVDKFYSDKYPLGRKKVQKLLYLFRRHQEADTSAFKKKAAGPYADEVRYKGGEPIAISSKYISVKRGNKGSSFSKGEKIADALTYLENWNLNDDLKWLCEQFKYIKTDRLELLATIDMAICDLTYAGITVTVDSIKELIKSHSEWKEKLSKSYFKDNDIAWAIKECKRLFE